MNINEKIFRWLNPDGCWHEDGSPPYKCRCGRSRMLGESWANPAYDTDPSACLALVEAVRAQGYEIVMKAEAPEIDTQWGVKITAKELHVAFADTLPQTVCEAVSKLIDAEAKR